MTASVKFVLIWPKTTLPCCWSIPLAHAHLCCPPEPKGLSKQISACAFALDYCIPGAGSHISLEPFTSYNTISSLCRVDVPSWVRALFLLCHTRTWSSRCTQCRHLGQLLGCWALLAPAFLLRSSVYEWQTIWAIDYHQPVRQFFTLLMALNIMGYQQGHKGTIASSTLLKSR